MTNKSIEDLAKSYRNQYHNNWQKRNKDRVKKAQERYWQKKAQKALEENNRKDDT